MIMDTKQFCKAVRIIAIKKHKAKLYSRYTFGTSGDTSMFTTFGKRKISFNFIGTKKQFNLIRKDLVKLFKGTWQQNFVKYKWSTIAGKGKHGFRIEGTCTFADYTKEEFDKRMEQTLRNVAWGKIVA
mgnify:FL=1